jgi:Holliday junction resolvasome RuvABC DNA-binding subunit
MPRHFEPSEGLIEGLYLPQLAWDVFHRENIQTIDQLRAVAGQLERFDGIGSKTAHAIRLELDRVAAPGEQTSGEGQLSAWAA